MYDVFFKKNVEVLSYDRVWLVCEESYTPAKHSIHLTSDKFENLGGLDL